MSPRTWNFPMGKRATLIAAAALVAMSLGARAQDALVVAATTSVEDSGLFDHITPLFTAKTGIAIRVVSRASAVALMTAERGTIDLVIVNDADALDRFVAAGDGARRHRFMSNSFVIVGPTADPAGVKAMTDAAAALREIARQRAPFVSRGDNSGTHVAEMHLWQAANVNPKARSGNWYRETGLGMGLTVQMASRLGAYTLSDRATWAKSGDRTSSAVMVESDPRLFNPYEVVLVSQSKHPHVNVPAATAFIDWLISREGRDAIAGHRVNGEQLFVPTPGPVN
jgi:tungstate transport system substrate-binding protein